jgi:hypothetical protein
VTRRAEQKRDREASTERVADAALATLQEQWT